MAMRNAGWVVAAALVAGCAAQHKEIAAGTGGAGSEGTVAAAASRRYIDPELGFEISRPDGTWQLDAGEHGTSDGLVIPVVLRHGPSGAQVILQIAPAVASPAEFAERLTAGLRRQPGFVAGDPEPVPLSDNSVGFTFAVGDTVSGRVAILGGGAGQVFLIMATWPTGAPDEISRNVDQIFSSLQLVPRVPQARRGPRQL